MRRRRRGGRGPRRGHAVRGVRRGTGGDRRRAGDAPGDGHPLHPQLCHRGEGGRVRRRARRRAGADLQAAREHGEGRVPSEMRAKTLPAPGNA